MASLAALRQFTSSWRGAPDEVVNSAQRGRLAVNAMRCLRLIRPRKLGHLEVNCPIGAREATLGCPLKGKANPLFYILRGLIFAVLQRGYSVLFLE